MQSFFAPKPTMASAASTAAPSTTNPSPPPKLRSLFRCVVLANAGDEPNLKRILCVSAEGWIERYHSDPASASVELADTTMRLAERIDRQQVGLAGRSAAGWACRQSTAAGATHATEPVKTGPQALFGVRASEGGIHCMRDGTERAN